MIRLYHLSTTVTFEWSVGSLSDHMYANNLPKLTKVVGKSELIVSRLLSSEFLRRMASDSQSKQKVISLALY
jgi:hypothetical protein